MPLEIRFGMGFKIALRTAPLFHGIVEYLVLLAVVFADADVITTRMIAGEFLFRFMPGRVHF